MNYHTIDFNKFISSISLALDLAESCVFKDQRLKATKSDAFAELDVKSHNFASHSKKTALIVLHMAHKLQYQGQRLNDLYTAAYLHDIGAVDALSLCHNDIDFVYEHCEFGASIIKKLPIVNDISDFIRYHHENYDGSGPFSLSFSDIPQEAQIIHLADFFEIAYRKDIGQMQRGMILNWLRAQKFKMFDPYLVDMLLEIAENERFWMDLLNIEGSNGVLERLRPKIYTPLSLCQLVNVSSAFASIIDKKSSFTHMHSFGLTEKVGKVASLYGFDFEKTEKMKIAALLHDLGKLAIPNSILDKPGKLTSEEYTLVKSHTYYTRLVLDKIEGIEDICDWASNHHETLNGTGYPEGFNAEKLTLESRIMAVCDIYQALTEDRPYRLGMNNDKAVDILDRLVEAGNIDGSVVHKLKETI